MGMTLGEKAEFTRTEREVDELKDAVRTLIKAHLSCCDRGEFMALCAKFGINPEELVGRTAKAKKGEK